MGRQPKPYRKGKNFCTSMNGRKHHVLCPISDGIAAANTALSRLVVADEQAEKFKQNPQVDNPDAFVGGPEGDVSPMLATALEEFLDHKQANCAAGTYNWYVKNLAILRELFGHRPIHTIQLSDANEFKTYLMQGQVNKRTGKKGDYKPTTVNHRLTAGKAFFQWACRPSNLVRFRLRYSPFEEVKKLVSEGRQRVITPEEWEALEANVADGGCKYAGREMVDILRVMRYTTLRPGELRMMRWENINWNEGQQRITFPAPVVKTRQRRFATLAKELVPVLLERRKLFDKLGKPKQGLVFSTAGYIDGVRVASGSEEPVKAEVFATRFRRLRDRCVDKGLIEEFVHGEKLVPYSSRHTRVTEMFEEGHEQYIVQADAGHASPVTTEKYKHLASGNVAKSIHAKRESNSTSSTNAY